MRAHLRSGGSRDRCALGTPTPRAAFETRGCRERLRALVVQAAVPRVLYRASLQTPGRTASRCPRCGVLADTRGVLPSAEDYASANGGANTEALTRCRRSAS